LSDTRIPTHLWVEAELRRCSVAGRPAVVVHKGEKMGGTVMLKTWQPGVGCRLYSQMRDLDDRLGWLSAHKEETIPEADADERIRRAVSRDPDLWVIEIETSDGTHDFGSAL